MSSPKMEHAKDVVKQHWMAWLPIAIIAATGMMAWGDTMARVSNLEKGESQIDVDHDRVVRIETQVEQIQNSVQNVHDDVEKVKQQIDTKFDLLLIEVRRQASRDPR